MASGARSTASEHIKTSYVANKVETAKLRGDNECLRVQIQEMEAKLRQMGQSTPDESPPGRGGQRAKFVDVEECSVEDDVSNSSVDSEDSAESASEYDDEESSRSGSESPSGDQRQGPPSTK